MTEPPSGRWGGGGGGGRKAYQMYLSWHIFKNTHKKKGGFTSLIVSPIPRILVKTQKIWELTRTFLGLGTQVQSCLVFFFFFL